MFDPNTVYFGKNRRIHVDCASEYQAQLVVQIAELGVSGTFKLPQGEEPCADLQKKLTERLRFARARFDQLASRRTSDDRLQFQIIEQLTRWFVLGKDAKSSRSDSP